jgi:hypothetical protein
MQPGNETDACDGHIRGTGARFSERPPSTVRVLIGLRATKVRSPGHCSPLSCDGIGESLLVDAKPSPRDLSTRWIEPESCDPSS